MRVAAETRAEAALTASRVVLAARLLAALAAGVFAGQSWIAVAIVVVAAVAQLVLLTRLPPFALLAIDVAVLTAALALGAGAPAAGGLAATSAAFAGFQLGFAALPFWVGLLIQAYVVTGPDAPALAATLAAGLAAATLTAVLARLSQQAAERIEAAQRSAAALERARLARELHDSVAKTVRGMSLAALALPRSVGGQSPVAVQLADAISAAAETADRETRALLSGLRLDEPDQDFRRTLEQLCRVWSAGSGVAVDLDVPDVDPPVPVRYELAWIVREALTNVARHARAGRVLVMLTRHERMLRLVVRDDGAGFAVPAELSELQEHDHFGVVGMVERARGVGGTLTVTSAPGHGTIVTAWAPT